MKYQKYDSQNGWHTVCDFVITGALLGTFPCHQEDSILIAFNKLPEDNNGHREHDIITR